MEDCNFWYWLQGWYELAGDAAGTLTRPQVEVIVNHLMLVEGRGENLASAAVMIRLFKDGMLSAENLTTKLRELSAAQFLHVIDPSAGGPEVQAKLNAIHGPPQIGGKGPGGVLMRC